MPKGGRLPEGVPPPPPVGPRLKAARARAGLTWDQLAARSGIDRATIGRIEGAQVDPTRSTIWALAVATGADPAWLAGFRDEAPEPGRVS